MRGAAAIRRSRFPPLRLPLAERTPLVELVETGLRWLSLSKPFRWSDVDKLNQRNAGSIGRRSGPGHSAAAR